MRQKLKANSVNPLLLLITSNYTVFFWMKCLAGLVSWPMAKDGQRWPKKQRVLDIQTSTCDACGDLKRGSDRVILGSDQYLPEKNHLANRGSYVLSILVINCIKPWIGSKATHKNRLTMIIEHRSSESLILFIPNPFLIDAFLITLAGFLFWFPAMLPKWSSKKMDKEKEGE